MNIDGILLFSVIFYRFLFIYLLYIVETLIPPGDWMFGNRTLKCHSTLFDLTNGFQMVMLLVHHKSMQKICSQLKIKIFVENAPFWIQTIKNSIQYRNNLFKNIFKRCFKNIEPLTCCGMQNLLMLYVNHTVLFLIYSRKIFIYAHFQFPHWITVYNIYTIWYSVNLQTQNGYIYFYCNHVT